MVGYVVGTSGSHVLLLMIKESIMSIGGIEDNQSSSMLSSKESMTDWLNEGGGMEDFKTIFACGCATCGLDK